MSTNAARGRCTVVVGCQWGDEGKGKIVDVLAESADIVARYQGGANAGHTVHVHGDEFILHQIPSGILHPGKRCLLGNGVVLDLPKFFAEYDALVERGIELEGRIGISQRAHLLLPYHRALDHAAEVRAREKIGTTGQGIGPAYVSKSGRRGVRVTDLGNASRLERLVETGHGGCAGGAGGRGVRGHGTRGPGVGGARTGGPHPAAGHRHRPRDRGGARCRALGADGGSARARPWTSTTALTPS